MRGVYIQKRYTKSWKIVLYTYSIQKLDSYSYLKREKRLPNWYNSIKRTTRRISLQNWRVLLSIRIRIVLFAR